MPLRAFTPRENLNISVIDTETETHLANNDTIKVYALGYKTNLGEEAVTYYIEKVIYSDVLNLINVLLIARYRTVNFYCHNLGGYDIVFIIKVLTDFVYSCTNEKDRYKINCIFRDDRILKVTISKRLVSEKGIEYTRKLTICDSYAMLNNNLQALAKIFEVANTKGIFPYKFSRENNIFYLGNTTGRHSYNDHVKQEEYLTNEFVWSDC